MISYTLSRPLSLSLYKAIRADIESGTLCAKTKLPSKRQYAMDLHLSLSTVEQALDLLEQEGYIECFERKGMFVCAGMERRRDSHAFEIELLCEDDPRPDADFPASLWFKTMRLVMNRDEARLSQTSPAAGSARLRNVIARYLHEARGMHVQPEQIVIASGAQELYAIVARLFYGSFDVALQEGGYPVAGRVYVQNGAVTEFLPADESGILPESLQKCRSEFLHVSPFYNYPMPAKTSAARRKAFLDWIADKDGFLIEDDFNSEFVLGGPVLQTLYELDAHEKVIYLNTFSKTLSSSLRLGYMVLPRSLIGQYKKTAQDLACTVTMLEQYTLAEFIENGSFERLVARRRRHQMAAGKRV